MAIEDFKYKLELKLDVKRFTHSLNVMETAVRLAGVYRTDVRKAEVAGLMHDCARNLNRQESMSLCEKYGVRIDEVSFAQPELLHGPLGAKIAEFEYCIKDKEILDAICSHTTGRVNMTALEKIIYVADCIEPSRNFPGVELLRKTAFENLDKAVILSLDSSIKHVIMKGAVIHPDSVHARNYLILEGKEGKQKP